MSPRTAAHLSDRQTRHLDDLLEEIEAAYLHLLATRRRLWAWEERLVTSGVPAAAIARARGIGRSVVSVEIGRLRSERASTSEAVPARAAPPRPRIRVRERASTS